MTDNDYIDLIRNRGSQPEPGDLDAAPALDRWSVACDGRYFSLCGMVSGHPHLRDGSTMHTSPLLRLNRDERWARTRSRFYLLGEVEQQGLLLASAVQKHLNLLREAVLSD